MDLLNTLKNISNSKNFVESKNYYYDYHICDKTNDKSKIMLDFTLSNDLTDEIIRFGSCNSCGLCIYHKDYKNNSF